MKTQKTAVISITLILTLTMSALMIAIPPVYAPSTAKIPTYMLLNVAPNPIGVGQTLYVNAFLSKPTVTATGPQGDRYEGLTVNMIQPDGTNKTWGPYIADPTGGIWFQISLDVAGNYTFQAFYPGQVLKYGTQYNGLTYLSSSSDPVKLVVQQEATSSGYQTPSLPTEYWSRPIYGTNYQWATIGGNWFGLKASGFTSTGGYDATGAVQKYSTAPNTAHITWVKPTKIGGQVGSPMPNDQTYMYSSTSVLQTEFEPIIINGVIYYCTYPAGINIPQSWQAVDLRTGQPLSTWNTTAGVTGTERLRYGEVLGYHTIQEFGAIPLLWSIQTDIGKAAGAYGAAQSAGAGTAPSNVTFRLYDPLTGYYYCSIVNGSDMPMIADYNPDTTEPGTLLGWYTSSNSTSSYLNLWNSTRAIVYPWGFTGGLFTDPRTNIPSNTERTIRLGWEGPNGNYSVIPFSSGIQWTVQLPNELDGNTVSGLSIAARTPEVILLRSAPSTASAAAGYQVTVGINARTGTVMWGPINQTIPAFHDVGLMAARDGYYVLRDKDTDQLLGYSLQTGKQLWGPLQLPGNAWSHIASAGQIAYGKLFTYDYGGYVNAVDLATGAINWTFTPRSSGYDSPLGNYPIWTYDELVCDGKIFLPEGKLYDPPISANHQRLAINCTDGSLVWSVLSYAPRITAAAADGYMVQWNSYDKQIYTFGKGQTATTVSAKPSMQGRSMVIEGTIMDNSPGASDADRAARFPNGLPAISDASMSHFMEYVYMQQPKPTNATGVSVTLSVIDANGNYREIGTTASNADGFFTYNWTPDIPGQYVVYATFAGSESYWPSNAVTSFAVDSPQASPTPQTEIAQPPTEMYFAISTAAIILAIAIVGAILLMAVRKRA